MVACPFGVVERNQDDGRAFKCTFCYDRQIDGHKPACATACPTESIKFGELDELRSEARDRVEKLQEKGIDDAQLYDPVHTSVGGIHALFIVRGDPKTYNLPPNPEVPTIYLRKGWTGAAVAAGLMLGGALQAFLGESGAANYFSTLAQPYAPTPLGWSPRWVSINIATQTGSSSNLSAFSLTPNFLTPRRMNGTSICSMNFCPNGC